MKTQAKPAEGQWPKEWGIKTQANPPKGSGQINGVLVPKPTRLRAVAKLKWGIDTQANPPKGSGQIREWGINTQANPPKGSGHIKVGCLYPSQPAKGQWPH